MRPVSSSRRKRTILLATSTKCEADAEVRAAFGTTCTVVGTYDLHDVHDATRSCAVGSVGQLDRTPVAVAIGPGQRGVSTGWRRVRPMALHLLTGEGIMKKLDRQNRAGVAALSNQVLRTVAGGREVVSKVESNTAAKVVVRAAQAAFE
jgi:hypothetical protein